MKSFEEMTFQERVDWAKGYLLISIGRGEFESAMWSICSTFNSEAYESGKKEAIKPRQQK